MIERATGVILRTRPLTETSLIVHWLSREVGRIATAAKGARRPKSPFLGRLDLFHHADFVFTRSRRSDLHTLREAELLDSHEALRHDLDRLKQAVYCAALVEQTTEPETPLPEVFQLVHGVLKHLDERPARPRLVFAFELKLLKELGLTPAFSKSRLAPATRDLAETLTGADWKDLDDLQPGSKEVKQLNSFLHGFLIYHLGRIPSGRPAALH